MKNNFKKVSYATETVMSLSGIWLLVGLVMSLLSSHKRGFSVILYGIMTEDLVIREIRIDEATGRCNSDSQMTSFEVTVPHILQSTMNALL